MKQAKTVQVGISGREIKDFKSLWQTLRICGRTQMQTWTQPFCHLLNQSLGFWFWIFEILQRKEGKKKELPGYLWEKQNDM